MLLPLYLNLALYLTYVWTCWAGESGSTAHMGQLILQQHPASWAEFHMQETEYGFNAKEIVGTKTLIPHYVEFKSSYGPVNP